MATYTYDSIPGIIALILTLLFFGGGSLHFIASFFYTIHAFKRDRLDNEFKEEQLDLLGAINSSKHISRGTAKRFDDYWVISITNEMGISVHSGCYKKGGEEYDLAEFLYKEGGVFFVRDFWATVVASGEIPPLFFNKDSKDWIRHLSGENRNIEFTRLVPKWDEFLAMRSN